MSGDRFAEAVAKATADLLAEVARLQRQLAAIRAAAERVQTSAAGSRHTAFGDQVLVDVDALNALWRTIYD